MDRLDGIELARGYFDEITIVPNGLRIKGWMLLPDQPFDSISVLVNGWPVGCAEVKQREDLARAYPWIEHAEQSGFRFVLRNPYAEIPRMGHVDVVGCRGGRPIGRMSTLFRIGLDEAVPTPPAELMERAAGTREAWFFKINGLKSFGEFLAPICRHRELGSLRRMLDWGCGCGRVTVHFLQVRDSWEVYGCDVDPAPIAWCQQNLPRGKFARVDAQPPTEYPAGLFDLVIGFSVFTHLPAELQDLWLAEMRRIISPGGLFLASTHGAFAARFECPETYQRLLRDGILYGKPETALDGIVPQGAYYQHVFQTRDHTIRAWSKYFEIVEHIERGMGNHQDLVVMRRPK